MTLPRDDGPTTPSREPAGWSERERLAALDACGILDTPPEPEFDDAVQIARQACRAPMALISLVAETRQWFKAASGLALRETGRDASVCAHALGLAGPLVIPDLARDPRTARNPLVTGPPGLRFYAGHPLVGRDGLPLGALCVLDTAPRPGGLSEEELVALAALARQVMTQIELRRALAERDRALAAARASRHDLRLITDALPVLIATIDRDEVYRFVNRHYETWFGLSPERIVGRSLREVIGEGAYAERRPHIARALAGEPARFEIRLPRPGRAARPGGAARDVRVQYVPAEDGGFHLLAIDVTAEKAAEAAMADSLMKFRAIAESMPQMVWSTLPDGYHDYYNSRWYEFTGVAPGSTDGEGWNAIFHPDDRAEAWRRWRRALATGETYEIEYRLRRRDGVHRWVLGRAVPLRDPASGAIQRWFGTCTDIDDQVRARETLARGRETLEILVRERTAALEEANARLTAEMAERGRVEERLRQAQKMEAVGQLTGGIAHDFNNLLTGITGALDLLRARLAEGRLDALPRYADLATASAQRAAALTHRLLAFARRQPLAARGVDANALVASMGDLLRRTLSERVALDLDLAEDLWATLCDPNQLENAILNLAINARDAMPEGGRLTIATANLRLDGAALAGEDGPAPGDYVRIAVRDTGAGMPPDVAARAFEPFFTTKPLGEGTGLGLSMIYGFAKQSDGQVRIASEVARGTEVSLILPRHHGPAAASLAPRPAPARGPGTGTILVVEDDPTVRALIAETLSDRGYRVREAADGPAGLAALEAAPVDLVVTDVGLPGLNGRQMIDQARGARPDLRVLFITGYAENAAFGGGHLEAGMAMITKPFAIEALAAKVQAILEAGAPAEARP
ncbi:multi-sensor hybrid histidine kinase [Methylobacterium sp. 4-46]|uniref:PAS domain-containing protein n=1 Tax=unclassified Methylobacterium TaxID=2615210 RepID=UPI000152CDA6|nr:MULTISPECIES: PAS domain-containing protein [Methylobacterium]ACA15215.1 multi-sensor hybrid histidine kinase [Methylobacterium sp. 4-46]WFT80945.1 PAS domain-containing protein [Methylobacterium nodulans]